MHARSIIAGHERWAWSLAFAIPAGAVIIYLLFGYGSSSAAVAWEEMARLFG